MLKGEHIYLRGIEVNDLDFISQIENNPQNWRYSETLIPFSAESLKNYVIADHNLLVDNQIRFIICLKSNDKAIGALDLFDYDAIHQRAGTGVLLEKAMRHKGYATEALKLIVNYAFNFLNLHQLWANISQDNPKSIMLFERVGFKQSGNKIQWQFHGGKWWDVGFYQLINPNGKG